MSRSRCITIVVVLVLALAAAGAPAAHAAAAPSEPEASVSAKKKKKKKPKKCKKGRVRERIQKKTRCVSARKAWPKPKAIDVRKAATSYVLNANFSKLRDRRGKRLPSLPKLLRKVHPRAEKALLGATKAGLARYDARARAAQAPCGSGPSASTSSTYDAGGGLSVGITSTFGADAAMQLNLESNRGNRRVRIEIEFPSCGDGSQIDSCPTADGTVRGRDNTRVGLRAYLYEGNTEVWSQGISLQGETTFRGVVGDDAKLEFMEPHNTETATIALGGSSRGFEPITMRTLIQRITRVNMKTGEYVLGPSIINVSISSRGLGGSEQRAVELQVGADMRQRADQQFRDIIDKAIRKFRERENAWNEPNTCATVDFTPASNSRPLKIGDTGVVSARVLAKPGGSPDRATWTRLGATNATFSPDTASAVPTNFAYRDILAAGQGITVTGTFKAVSKAGVAQGNWTQPTENLDVNTIAGTLSGVWKAGGSVLSWSGNASFARALPGPGANGTFFLTSGHYTVTASGKDASGGTGCVQSGTKAVTLTNNGHITVTGQGPGQTAPYEYSGTAAGIGPQDANMMVTLSSCPVPMNNGQRVTIGLPFVAFDTVDSKVSADGLDYTGASSRPGGILTQDWNWAMRGTP
jgi:hypothetical protein